MTSSLTLLDSVTHANLRLLPNSGARFAAVQHVLPIRAEEIAKAVSSFPVFLTRNTSTESWSFSMVTSLEVERNLFVEDDQWMATYVPQIMNTYPFYLMPTDTDGQYALGVDEASDVLSMTEGERVFDEKGKMSPWVDNLTKQMDLQMQSNQQTFLFAKAIEEAGLIKELGAHVVFADDTSQTINGLHTIDEEKLQALDAETLADFNKRGYLTPLHAMLLSIFQLNALVRLHNRANESHGTSKSIRQLKLQVARDAGAKGDAS